MIVVIPGDPLFPGERAQESGIDWPVAAILKDKIKGHPANSNTGILFIDALL